MSRGPRLVLLGKQGAGKGTQAERLGRHFDVELVSTGELFRDAAKAGTAFGLEAQRYMDAGELVPDDIVIGVVEERFGEGGPLERGFVLDGFPRTLPQAVELDRVLGVASARRGHRPRGARPRSCSTGLPAGVCARTAGARTTSACRPRNRGSATPAAAESCSATTTPRPRSCVASSSTTRKRSRSSASTARRGKLVSVDGVGDGDEVFERLLAVVDAHCEPCAS